VRIVLSPGSYHDEGLCGLAAGNGVKPNIPSHQISIARSSVKWNPVLQVDCPQRLMPTLGGGDDVLGIGFSGEGRRLLVVVLDEAVTAACRLTRDVNTPRLRRRLVSLAKKPSTAFSHEHEVGVKWKIQRG
jgi:hypothetical protein